MPPHVPVATDGASETWAPTMRYGQATGRRDQILNRVQRAGFCSVTELAQELGVSDMTIRRDVRRLEVDGEVRLVHGGISLTHATLRTSEFTARAGMSAEAKNRIAVAAVAHLRHGDVVGIDAGTTAFAVATHLPERFVGYVVTHSVPVMQHLLNVPAVRMTGLGGELHTPSQAFAGTSTVEQARRLRLSTFFLGVAAADAEGVYVEAEIERDTKNTLVDVASNVVLVVDHRKFEKSAPVRLCGFDRIQQLVTDEEPPAPVRDALQRWRTKVLLAP